MKIHSSSLPLFADIERYNTLPDTKSVMSSAQAEDYLISLGDLIDRDNSESITFEQYEIEAIPFKEEFCSGAVSVTSEDMDNPTADSLSCSKIYYVNTLDTETDTTDLMVVTMIPDHTYLSEHNVSEISYLDKAEYSGMILYSDIDGAYREACYFKRGLMEPIFPLNPGAISDSLEVHYLTTYQIVETKSMAANEDMSWVSTTCETTKHVLGGSLIPARCYAYTKIIIINVTTSSRGRVDVPLSEESRGNSSNSGPSHIGNGSSGTTNKSTTSEKQKFTVSLTAQMANTSEYCGSVRGNGTYANGTFVHCEASANKGFVFDGWTGNMPGSGPWVDFAISSNITATATFIGTLEKSAKRPCWNKNTKVSNPLAEMEIAPTDKGNLDNGVYSTNNPNRYSGKHDGIDLAAEVGTPIYAPYDGIIGYPFVTEQPQRDSTMKSDEWPEGYTGDKNGAGNRVCIKSTLPSGEKITCAFWHLQADTPVAINPRKGRTFEPRDTVYQGDIIGYVGRTGNAYDIENTHLHFGVKNSNGKWIDPEPYLNGSVKRKNGKVEQAEFEDVKCDSKGDYYNYSETYLEDPE